MFNFAIDSKPRGCALVALNVDDVEANGYVGFKLTEQTRQSLDDHLRSGGLKPGQRLFPGPANRLVAGELERR